MDFNDKVLLREFESALRDNHEKLNTPRSAHVIAEVPGKKDLGDESSGKAVVADGSVERVESTALIIRIKSESGVGDSLSDSKVSSDEKDPSFDLLCSLFDQTSVTFPSVFRHVSENVVDERFPFVSVHPSFLEKTGNEESCALDSLSLSFFGDRFLADEETYSSGSPSSWLHNSLKRKYSSDSCIPVGALVLARFEAAVMESFLSRNQQVRPTALLVDLRLSDHNKRSSMRGIEESSGDMDASANETEVSIAETENESRPTLHMLVADLISHARAFDSGTINVDTLMELIGPFLLAFKVDEPELCKVETLLLTPMRLLGQTGDSLQNIDFSLLDEGVSSALKRVKDYNASSETVAETGHVETNEQQHAPSDVGTSEEQDVVISEEQQPEIQTSGQKKKRRKSRKRKVSVHYSCAVLFRLSLDSDFFILDIHF